MSMTSVRFNNRVQEQKEFIRELRLRVHEYFKRNSISTHANRDMYIKTGFMLLLYFVPFLGITLFTSTSVIWNLLMWVIMGFGMAGIGLSVMHDANHGTYSSNPIINKIFGSTMFLLGGNPVNWRIQHNVLHHSFTNIDGLDEDISPVGLLRFSPHKPLKKMHKFQYLYAWPLYTLMTIMWVVSKDFKQVMRYQKSGLLDTQQVSKGVMWTTVILSKVFYYAIFLGLPIFFTSIPFGYHILGFVLMHLIGGFILTIIFQPAHVMPEMEYPLPDDQGSMENHFAIHELMTTTNFAPKNKILTWYAGGLNFQIEHHLFPNICHVHYPAIAPIVQQTCKEFNLPYYSVESFRTALGQHAGMLRKLGVA